MNSEQQLPTDEQPASASVPALEIEDLTVAYQSKPALWDVDVTVPQGVLMAIVGPNGAGKSTLIKAALGLIPRAAGDIRFFGKSYAAARRLVGYVPQRGSVDWDFPTSVLDVVMMGLYGHLGWFRRPGKVARRQALEALDQVGMADFAKRQISQLSGGQQQRTFLARALVQDAQFYFMDEPFAAVDAVTERAIVSLLRELRARGRTVVVVHHDLQTVEDYFDWVTLMNVEVVASGPVGETFTEENLQQAYGGRVSANINIMRQREEVSTPSGRRLIGDVAYSGD
jgi:manganese/zinc/iron transport system ATP- binding protein